MGKEATMPRDLRPEEFRVVPDRYTWQIHRTGRELSVSESKGQYGSWEEASQAGQKALAEWLRS